MYCKEVHDHGLFEVEEGAEGVADAGDDWRLVSMDGEAEASSTTELPQAVAYSEFLLEDHVIFPLKLQTSSATILTFALIGCGSMTNDIDSTFVLRHSLPLVTKPTPISVRGADGQLLVQSQITHSTRSPFMTIGSYHESLQLDVTILGQYPSFSAFHG